MIGRTAFAFGLSAGLAVPPAPHVPSPALPVQTVEDGLREILVSCSGLHGAAMRAAADEPAPDGFPGASVMLHLLVDGATVTAATVTWSDGANSRALAYLTRTGFVAVTSYSDAVFSYLFDEAASAIVLSRVSGYIDAATPATAGAYTGRCIMGAM